MRYLLLGLDLAVSLFLLGVLRRLPPDRLPQIFLWYILVAILKTLSSAIPWGSEARYAEVYRDALVATVLVLAFMVVRVSIGSEGLWTMISVAAAVGFALWFNGGRNLWSLEAGAYVASGMVLWVAWPSNHEPIMSALLGWLGTLFFLRGWMVFFTVPLHVRHRAWMEVFARPAFSLLSLLLLGMLALSLLPFQSEGQRESHSDVPAVRPTLAINYPSDAPALRSLTGEEDLSIRHLPSAPHY